MLENLAHVIACIFEYITTPYQLMKLYSIEVVEC